MDRIDDAFACALEYWTQIIRRGAPKLVPFVRYLPPILLVTDGYCDPKADTVVAGFGALTLDVVGGLFETFWRLLCGVSAWEV